MSAESIFLIGPMGAGKSTLGRLLADVLGRDFHDSDRIIEERAGANIPWIFDLEGESGFRERESQVIDELTQRTDLVVATGGGAVVRPENRQVMQDRAWVVYLRTRVATQLERTAKDKNRPLLQRDDPAKILTELLAAREPHYLALAHLTVDTDDIAPKTLAERIAQEYRIAHENA
ncbi:shikimate kinase AroK [Salinispirillum marinum]|uniref:Shikimate kinase n=2 Tax=Saccharospirillaceae TaxID=255527 RepID=A0ABV8BDT3_9GAMM